MDLQAVTYILIREGQRVLMQTHAVDTKMKVKFGMIWPQAKECLQPLEAERWKE